MLNSSLNGVLELLEKAGVIITIVYAAKMINDGTLSSAVGVTLVIYVMRLINPLINIVDYIDTFSEELALRKDYEKIINYINRNSDDGTIEMDGFNNEIRLKNVMFSYDKTSTSLKGINMVIHKGEKIGICGVSGGGKSTLFKLINRFYKVDSGKITIDGININSLTRKSFSKHVGSVHQENTIFPGTIRENIMYANQHALEQELIDACKKANIYNFIMELPEKFETEVGPRGLKLSGGQKQRIALARLFLRNPDIILLDEATSALDNESETLIQEAIDNLDGKTVITIAHRLSTIRNCDQIFVLGNKGILEHGTHDQLLKRNGAYAMLLK